MSKIKHVRHPTKLGQLFTHFEITGIMNLKLTSCVFKSKAVDLVSIFLQLYFLGGIITSTHVTRQDDFWYDN